MGTFGAKGFVDEWGVEAALCSKAGKKLLGGRCGRWLFAAQLAELGLEFGYLGFGGLAGGLFR